ncbi:MULTISPECIES: hypothetical protein [Candidatus Ichthyocystis]|uniref:hypothetical protein n=1 Tax=Candidatus Ichthyocystis TaxID=2929841 RepID=UPI000B8863AC|nr:MULTISPECIES: hypothetical protein [Ichthyocystis]
MIYIIIDVNNASVEVIKEVIIEEQVKWVVEVVATTRIDILVQEVFLGLCAVGFVQSENGVDV